MSVCCGAGDGRSWDCSLALLGRTVIALLVMWWWRWRWRAEAGLGGGSDKCPAGGVGSVWGRRRRRRRRRCKGSDDDCMVAAAAAALGWRSAYWWLGCAAGHLPAVPRSAPPPHHITILIHADQAGPGNYGSQNRLLLASFGCAEAQVGCLRPHSKGTASRRCCVARLGSPARHSAAARGHKHTHKICPRLLAGARRRAISGA